MQIINKEKLKIKQLEKEIQGLKDDWLMVDAVCDEKQFKIIELKKELKKYTEQKI